MPLLIRADASPTMGTGHIMRCLALAQAWQAHDGAVIFATHESLPEALRRRLVAENMTLHLITAEPGSSADADQTIEQAYTAKTAALVLDGYHFDADYQQRIKAAGRPLLVLDDYGHASHYSGDWILNQNIDADEALYPQREAYTRLLLGSRFALLRREFWPYRGWSRETPTIAQKILVTLGGSDPDNLSEHVIAALETITDVPLEIRLIVGGSNPHLERLKLISQQSCHTLYLENDVTDMASRLAWADLALTAAGSTVWELALLGVPACTLMLATNQQQIAASLMQRGATVNLGWHADFDPPTAGQTIGALLRDAERRANMTRALSALVDGWGSERVWMRLGDSRLRLRPAVAADARLIWQWANEPAVRAVSFSTASIPWEDHLRWFERRLASPDSQIYVALDEDDTPVGQIRFDRTGANSADISIIVDAAQRGQGLGTALIDLGTRTAFAEQGLSAVYALARTDNYASQKAFLKADFQPLDQEQVQGVAAVRFVRRRAS